LLLDVGCEAKEAHDLGHPGAGDAVSAGDVGLVGGLAGLEEGPPLEGLAEELDPRGAPWAAWASPEAEGWPRSPSRRAPST
jgi:hypothetical protein